MVIMASSIARGRVRMTMKTTESSKMTAKSLTETCSLDL